MTHNPYDTRQADADKALQQQRDELAQKQSVEDWKWLMAHKAGRRIVWKLLAEAGVFHNPFHNSGSQMAFNCGRMNQGQAIFAAVMEHSPDAYLLMTRESTRADSDSGK